MPTLVEPVGRPWRLLGAAVAIVAAGRALAGIDALEDAARHVDAAHAEVASG